MGMRRGDDDDDDDIAAIVDISFGLKYTCIAFSSWNKHLQIFIGYNINVSGFL